MALVGCGSSGTALNSNPQKQTPTPSQPASTQASLTVPRSAADLRLIAAKGNVSDLNVVTHQNGAQPGICESPFYAAVVSENASSYTRLSDALDFFFANHLDSYCAATIDLFYDAAQTQTAGELSTWPGDIVATLGTPSPPTSNIRTMQISADLVSEPLAITVPFDAVPSTPTTPQPATPGSLTLRSFDAVQIGMTLAQVQSLLGTGTLSEQSGSGDSQTAIYSWTEGNSGANAYIEFQNGKVVNKAQAGAVLNAAAGPSRVGITVHLLHKSQNQHSC